MMEIALPNRSKMVIAVKIFGAADGFRPSAWMLAYPPAAKMADGPKTEIIKISTSAASRPNASMACALRNHQHPV